MRAVLCYAPSHIVKLSSAIGGLGGKMRFIRLSAPIIVQWEVTPDCNNECVHCYNYWRTDKGEAKGSVQSTTLSIAAEQLIQNKVFHCVITGGEPLLVFDRIYPLIASLSLGGVQVSVNTNGVMLDREKAVRLKEAGVKRILVSLVSGDPNLHDDITQRGGSFARTVEGIVAASLSGIVVSVNMVVTKKNLASVNETAKFLQGIGVRIFSATKASAPMNCPDFSDLALTREEFQKMLQELARIKEEMGLEVDSLEHYPACSFPDSTTRSLFGNRLCSAGKTACTIGYDGFVRPCSHSHLIYGHISDGLQQAWTNLDPWRGEDLLPTECKRCNHLPQCSGGCRAEVYAKTGCISGFDSYGMGSERVPMKNPTKAPRVIKGDVFAFSPLMKHRPESFGGIVYVSTNNWLCIDLPLYHFVSSGVERFRLSDLANVLFVSEEEAKKTALLLLSKKLLIERR